LRHRHQPAAMLDPFSHMHINRMSHRLSTFRDRQSLQP